MFDVAPIFILLIATIIVAVGSHIAKHFGLTNLLGMGLTLIVIAAGLFFVPTSLQRVIAGSDTTDYLLTVARTAGVSGLLFLSGLRFSGQRALVNRRTTASIAIPSLLFFIVITALLITAGQQGYTSIITATAISVISPWFASELSQGSVIERYKEMSLASVLLAAIALVAVHLLTVLGTLHNRATGTLYGITIPYELVKFAVILGFGYFITTSFLSRAENRVSVVRLTLGYVIITVLLFVLAASSLGYLGAFSWSFISGVILGRSNYGEKFAQKIPYSTLALLVSFATLPLLMQAHGRTILNPARLVVITLSALILKFILLWGVQRIFGVNQKVSLLRLAVISLPPIELSTALLGTAVTTWEIGGEIYYGILLFAFISMILSFTAFNVEFKRSREVIEATNNDVGHLRGNRKKGASKKGKRAKLVKSVALTVVSIFIFLSLPGRVEVLAQLNTIDGEEEDPVSRAMLRIDKALDARVNAAEQVKVGSKVLEDAVAARKDGDKKRADELLTKAENLAAAQQQAERSALIDELYRSIALEREALNGKNAPITKSNITVKGLPVRPLSTAVTRDAITAVNKYRTTLGQVLQEENVPIELLAVAYVESHFNTRAVSPKGAGGIWQFMPATAARYGLQVTSLVDHRTHPEHSTRAAARYLRDLYKMFGDWKLALAGYNWGEGNVQKAIKRGGTRDFDELARRGYIPLETRKYVPAVLSLAASLGDELTSPTGIAKQ
jgi:hypothetical protein